MEFAEINFLGIEKNEQYSNLLIKVVNKCFEEENLKDKNLYVNIVLTNPETIRKINKEHRNINKETDVLSFPMFEKDELKKISNFHEDVLGDIVISIDRVKKQADEYGHSFERELSYMAVHGFCHLIGYDHIEETDKKIMRQKEENILEKLKIEN